ncbi:MAG: glucosamine-6-phosphate deaminase [Kiritimatiellae bacterium]|nr:glucosamine-6-phosphate deaminase [Kiritimatiellia bacterium]
MKTVVSPDKKSLGEAAAAEAAAKICAAVAARGEARVVFASAASQFEFIEALLAHAEIDWSKVRGFHLDEYVGLPADHPASFRRFLRERLLAKLPCPPRSFTFVGGDAPDAAAECARLEAAVREAPVDLACIGIGENGHVAFNDPPADFETKAAYAIVALDEVCRRQQVGEGWYPSLDAVPTHAYSMTVPQIMAARSIVCVVPDARKADAVAAAVEGPLTNLCPSSILRNHPDCTLYLDPPAASKLKSPPAP